MQSKINRDPGPGKPNFPDDIFPKTRRIKLMIKNLLHTNKLRLQERIKYQNSKQELKQKILVS